MNNNRGPPAGAPGSAAADNLSLLVNATSSVDSRDGAQRQPPIGAPAGLSGSAGLFAAPAPQPPRDALGSRSFAESLLMGGGQAGAAGLFSRNTNASQLQQQLAGLTGGGIGSLPGMGAAGAGASQFAAELEMQAAFAALRQQQAQPPQFTQADLLSLSRPGALEGLAGILGGGGLGRGVGAGASQLASELESLQRLEELERRQRLFAVAGNRPDLQSMFRDAAPPPGLAESRVPQPPPPELSLEPPKVAPVPAAMQAAVQVSAAPSSAADAAEAARGVVDAAAGDADTETTNEDLEKSPGSVIVPCRARGMPMDHNFKTAYFVIPKNVRHGEELICSYFACRNAGIKFRYCSHCKVPVAKRNFRKRHKHGGEEIVAPSSRNDLEDSGEDDVPVAAVKKGIPSQITANRRMSAEGDMSSQSAESASKGHDQKVAAGVPQGLVQELTRKAASLPTSAAARSNASGNVSEERQRRWMSLLANRPLTKDGDSMSVWLMEVLAVSDLDTPLKSSDEIAAVSQQQKNPASGGQNKSPPGSGSSNEELAVNEKKQASSGAEVALGFFAGGGIVKKKRPSDSERNDVPPPAAATSERYSSGSFAEWKERKKQKKAMETAEKDG